MLIQELNRWLRLQIILFITYHHICQILILLSWHSQFSRSEFDEFLRSAIELSHCDWFACEQFRHAADDVYIEQRVLNSIQKQIRAYERDIIENAELVELIEKEASEKEADEKEADEKEADEKEADEKDEES